MTSLIMAAAMMAALLSPAAAFAGAPEAVAITDASGNGNEPAGTENADAPETVICSNDPADDNEQAGSEETDRLSQYVNGYKPGPDTYYVGGKKMIRAAGSQESSGLLLSGSETVKKGLKKNTYTVKVKVTAAGNANYKPVTKTVPIRITVK